MPFNHKRLLRVERPVLRKSLEKIIRSVRVEGQSFVAAIAEHIEQFCGRLGQGLAGKHLQRGFNGSFQVLAVHHGRLITSHVTSSRSVFSCTWSSLLGRTKLRPDCKPDAARLRKVEAMESTAF